ncbi:Tn3 family transposase [Nonomuraea polychroma]|uniref:Tn3 family transposase n=1 Tax=Nonomuraea polychroma TaxID=46176 RepID=UPI003D90DCD0
MIVPPVRFHVTNKYLSDPVYRRKIARQLNKGESLHALRRDLHYAQQGGITKPALADQTDQAWCLTRFDQLCHHLDDRVLLARRTAAAGDRPGRP